MAKFQEEFLEASLEGFMEKSQDKLLDESSKEVLVNFGENI